MNFMKLGLRVDDLGLDAKRGIDRASALRLEGIQVGCGAGELHPDNLSESGRREFSRFVSGRRLELASIASGVDDGLGDAEANNRLVPAIGKCLAAAREMGTGLVTVSIGPVPEGEDSPARVAIAEALGDLERTAALHGAQLAVEAGRDPPERLAAFLKELALPSLRVNYDPGALAMRGWSATEGVRPLAELIAQAYATDGRFGSGESAIGEGEVDWRAYAAELASVGYHGYQIIRCIPGSGGVESAARAAAELREL